MVRGEFTEHKEEIDDLDARIMNALIRDARQTSGEMGKKLGVSGSTIRRRVNALVENSVLKVVAVPNPLVDNSIWAMIGINVTPGFADQVIEQLVKQPFIYTASEGLGRYNVICGAQFRSIQRLNEFVLKSLPALKGITNIETHVIVMPRKYYGFFWPGHHGEAPTRNGNGRASNNSSAAAKRNQSAVNSPTSKSRTLDKNGRHR